MRSYVCCDACQCQRPWHLTWFYQVLNKSLTAGASRYSTTVSKLFIRAAPHVSVRLLLYFTAVIYFLFFHFHQPNLGRLSTDLAG